MNEIQQRIETGEPIGASLAISSLRPGAMWALRDKVYSGLIWRDDTQEKPTQQEVIDEVERLKLVKESLNYRRDRLEEYLPLGEQLDLIYWDGINGSTNWSDHIASVKANHPKPV